MRKLPVALALLCLVVAGAAALFMAWRQGWLPRRGSVPSGPLMAETATYELAVYYLPHPKADPLESVRQLLTRQDYRTFSLASAPPDGKAGAAVFPRRLRDVRGESYAPPEPELVQRFGRGLSPAQALALQESREALVLDIGLPRERVWDGGRLASRLVSALARQEAGIIWDEETREVFTPNAWDERRLQSWTDTIPDVSRHTVIHAYRKGDLVRAISLGMSKFALPDIVVEDFPWSANRNMGHLVNLTAQALAEGAEVQRRGRLRLRLAGIRSSEVREPQLRSLGKNGKGDVELVLAPGVWEEGDPSNRLVEIRFDHYPGPDRHSRQEALLSEFFGGEDSIKYIEHDQELEAASARARTRLPELRRAFAAGLPPGGYLLLKAPFARPDGGDEWMWVEVTSWTGGKIRGLLGNDPFAIPTLHAGQEVEIAEGQVFDYILRHPDGSEEGNETGAIIERMSGETRQQ